MIRDFIGKNWFTIGILAALGLGVAFPGFGVTLSAGTVTSTWIVVVMFLILGFTLPSETLKTGLTNVRLHLFIQIYIFALIPAYFFLTTLPFRGIIGPEFLIGIFALACLPTTVSSCTVFTQISGGNAVATMFNASLSNVLGIFLSPLLISLLASGTGGGLPADEAVSILGDIALKMLLPIVAGQIIRIPFAETARKRKKTLGSVNNVLILVIVFLTFSKTVNRPDFIESIRELAFPVAYLAVSHLILLAGALLLSRAFRFGPADRISIAFAAPQKTLAMGVPLLSTYFAGREDLLGLAIIPLLFYHPFQILVAGIVKNRFGNRYREGA